MISFIVPAHDEERWISRSVGAIHQAARGAGEPYEVIVVDDASTDQTAELARVAGAEVISVTHRHISAARNTGARIARGDVLIFVDADTETNSEAVRAAVAAVRAGAVGGGCIPRFDRPLPLWGCFLYGPITFAGRCLKLVGGCFQFCSRAAFDAIGGYDERVFAAEDVAFLVALKRIGRVVVPRPRVLTSGRKLDVLGPCELVTLLMRLATRGPQAFRSRDELDILYGPRARKGS